MRTLIIEPHFDDTAYSMTGLILSGTVAAEDDDILILTVFTRSIFAPYADASGVDQISALRYGEHKEFCEQIQVFHHILGYDEAPQRGWSMDELFDTLYGNDKERALKEMEAKETALKERAQKELALKKQIRDDFVLLNESYKPDVVFSPLGICGHIDHILVRECAESVFSLQIRYYEDLPYAGEIPTAEYLSWINQLTNGLHPTKNPGVGRLARRIELLKLYQSQVTEKDIESVRNYLSMHQGERFWTKTYIYE